MKARIGDAQFRAMCEMWGVEQTIDALKGIGMTVSDEQVTLAREKEAEENERWENIFRRSMKEGT